VCENFARFLIENPKAQDRWLARVKRIDAYRAKSEFDTQEIDRRSLGIGFSESVKSFIDRMSSE
jgi:hypothetical protein